MNAPRIALAALLLLAAGCSRDLNTEYGKQNGIQGADSVNGTSVLGDMFQRAGHRVYSWTSLSPRLQQHADCIVWFPDDFAAPNAKVTDWLDQWLEGKPGRTLIYVGRDFDAAPGYWRKITPLAPSEQAAEVARRLHDAQTKYDQSRSAKGEVECAWFSYVDGQPRHVQTLRGRQAWGKGVKAENLDIEIQRRMHVAGDTRVVLASEKDLLVARTRVKGSQRFLVANGSFLLNLPLVNRAHRQLAGTLIEALGKPGQNVVFLESESGGPAIRAKEPEPHAPTGLEVLTTWPTNWILLHLIAAGIVYCFARWPIFGRPVEPKPEPAADFGKHVDALAALLERSQDRAYAHGRLMQYRQNE